MFFWQGTAYTPVNLGAPKKLVNPFAARQAETQAQASSYKPPISTGAASSAGSGKKLTWSERQALAKKQKEEEEARSASAISSVPGVASIPGVTSIVAAVAAVGNAVMGSPEVKQEEEEEAPPTPPPPPPPPPPGPEPDHHFKEESMDEEVRTALFLVASVGEMIETDQRPPCCHTYL